MLNVRALLVLSLITMSFAVPAEAGQPAAKPPAAKASDAKHAATDIDLEILRTPSAPTRRRWWPRTST